MRITAFFLSFCFLCLIFPVLTDAKTEEEYQQEIRVLQKRNTKLENKLEQVASDLKRSTEKIKTLQEQIARMIQEGEDNAREVKETRSAMKQVKEQLTTLLEQQATSQSPKIQQLEEQLAKHVQQNQNLEKEIKKIRKEREALEQTISAREKENQQLKKDVEQFKNRPTGDDAKQLQKELDSVRSELEKQRRQFKANLALLHDREQELQEVKAKIQEIPTQDSQQNPELQESRLKIEELQKEVTFLQTLLKQQKIQLEQKAASSPEQGSEPGAEERIVELEAMLTDVNAKAIRLAQEKFQLEAQLSEQQNVQHDDTVKDAEIKRLEGELLKAADYINARNNEVTAITQEKDVLTSQLAEAQKSLERMQTVVEEKQKSLEDLQIQVTKHSDTLQNQNRETEQLQAEERIVELEAMLTDVNAKAIRLAQEKSQLEAQLSEQQNVQHDDTVKDAEVKRLEGELLKAADYINARNNEVTAITQEKDVLTSQLAEAQKSLERMQTVVEEKQKSLEDLQIQVTEHSDTLQNQNRETEQLQNELTNLRKTLHETEQQNATLQENIAHLEETVRTQGSVPEAAKQRIAELTQELQGTKAQLDKQERVEKEYPRLQQEVAALHEQVTDLLKEQERANLLQTQLLEKQTALDQAHKELDAVATLNLELKADLQNKKEGSQTQQHKFQEISERNRVLEQQYNEGRKELELKEQLLQKVLTEKAVLEKVIDEEGSPFDNLKASLQDLERQNAMLRKQIQELNAVQIRKAEIPQKTASPELAKLQQQLLTEKTLRQQVEAKLEESHRQIQKLQEQGIQQSAALMPTQASSAVSSQKTPGQWSNAFFPNEILQHAQGGTLSVLGWSPDNSKLAYLESDTTLEQLWIFDRQTGQAKMLTEWQRRTSEDSLSQLAWAHDNEHFLFALGSSGQYRLYIGNSHKLLGRPIELRDAHIHFAWSPTQLQFAYFSASNLIVQNLRGETLPLQLGHQPGAAGTSLAWSPDGAKIAFSIKRGASFDVYTLLLSKNPPLLQSLVASSSDDLQPSWSPNGQYIAFYVHSKQYDTKLAVTPVDRSRAPYIVAHNVSMPPSGGPLWLSNTELFYVGEEHLSASQNSVYRVNVSTGQRSSAPLSLVFSK